MRKQHNNTNNDDDNDNKASCVSTAPNTAATTTTTTATATHLHEVEARRAGNVSSGQEGGHALPHRRAEAVEALGHVLGVSNLCATRCVCSYKCRSGGTAVVDNTSLPPPPSHHFLTTLITAVCIVAELTCTHAIVRCSNLARPPSARHRERDVRALHRNRLSEILFQFALLFKN